MTSFRRRLIFRGILPLLVLALIIGGYGVYWQQVAKQLQIGVEQWAAEQRAAGATVDFQWQGITGFPFAFTADFSGVNILSRLGGTALSARTDHLQLNMSPVDLNDIRLLCDRPLTVIVPGINLGTPGGSDNDIAGVRLTLDQADGLVRLSKGNPVGATIDANKARLDDGPEVLSVASLHLDVQLPEVPPQGANDPAATINLALSNADLPAGTPQLLPGPITEASLDGVIKGPFLPPAGTTEPPHDLAGFLAIWRDAGGVLKLNKFTFAQGPLDLNGDATIALDTNLQPEGAGKITATGLADLVDLLSARGAMKHKDAGIAQAVITGLQKPGANGRPEVTIGLSLQDKVVSFGFARLFKLPQIVWP